MALVHSCDVTTLDQLHPKNGPTNGLLPVTISKQLNLLVDYGNWLFNFFCVFYDPILNTRIMYVEKLCQAT